MLKRILTGYFLPLLLLICLLLGNLEGSSQKHQLDVRNLDVSKFPLVKMDLWVRDPDGINPDLLVLKEQDKNAVVSFKEKKLADSADKNKCIVFLVLNPGLNGGRELRWYKNVIAKSLSDGIIKEGDQIDILNFNHQFNGQILYPSPSLSFTDDLSVIQEKLNALSVRMNNPGSCSNRGSLVIPAINQTLDLIKESGIKVPAGIVVLSNDVVCINNSPLESPGDKSKRLNIPIYGISYAGASPLNSIDSLCEGTHGNYFRDFSGNEDQSADQLKGFLTSFNSRHQGLIYRYEWTSTIAKDGEPHPSTVSYKDLTTDFLLVVPKRNLLEWATANPLIAGGILLFLIAAVITLILVMRKQKQKREEKERGYKDQLSEMGKNQLKNEQEIAQVLSAQQSELEEIKKRERDLNRQKEEMALAEEKQKRDKLLLEKMRLRGNLPQLDCISGSQSYLYDMRKPEIIIGRAPDCDLSINNPTVSKKHCRLIFINDEYIIEDTGSVNGVLVNSQKKARASLKHGDVIRLGEVVINFRL